MTRSDVPTDLSTSTTFRQHLPLLLVGALYVAVQLLVFDLGRGLEWDEATYLSEVHPDLHPVGFGPTRARGVVFLVAPVALLSAAVSTVRLYLAVLSGVALVAAFWPWVRMIGGWAHVAAAAFAASWLTLFYGSELSPNLWVGFALVAAAGWCGRLVGSSPKDPWSRSAVAGLVIAIVWATLLRPSDATLAVVAMTAVAGIYPTRRKLLVMTSSAALLAGWLPWLVEAWARFGGPAARLSSSVGHVQGGYVSDPAQADVVAPIVAQLMVSDGPLFAPTGQFLVDIGETVPTAGVLWWAVLVLFSLIAAGFSIDHRKDTAPPVGLVAAAAGFAAASVYVTTTTLVAPRFLLPAYALLTVAAAAGLHELAPRHRRGRAVLLGGVAMLVAGVWLPYCLPVATAAHDDQVARRDATREVAELLDIVVQDHDCRFAAQYAHPQLAAEVPACVGTAFQPAAETLPGMLVGRDDGVRVVLTQSPAATSSPVVDWERCEYISSDDKRWLVYVDQPFTRPAGCRDIVDPELSVAPMETATVAGQVVMDGMATDDVALDHVAAWAIPVVDGEEGESRFIADQTISGSESEWQLSWDTSRVDDGEYRIELKIVDRAGNTQYVPGPTLRVLNRPALVGVPAVVTADSTITVDVPRLAEGKVELVVFVDGAMVAHHAADMGDVRTVTLALDPDRLVATTGGWMQVKLVFSDGRVAYTNKVEPVTVQTSTQESSAP